MEEKRFYIAAWSSTNLTWTALVTKPMLGERPANNHLFFYIIHHREINICKNISISNKFYNCWLKCIRALP